MIDGAIDVGKLSLTRNIHVTSQSPIWRAAQMGNPMYSTAALAFGETSLLSSLYLLVTNQEKVAEKGCVFVPRGSLVAREAII